MTSNLIATAFAAKTLHAPVRILGTLTDNSRNRVKVVTLRGGVGGWSKPGMEFAIEQGSLRDIRSEPVAAPPAPPAPVEVVTEVAQDIPVAEPVSPELLAALTELASLRAAAVANFERPTGGRGKRGLQRTNSALRRAAKLVEQCRVAECAVVALGGSVD